MSKHEIRKNKTCQNCGYFVENNYCPRCGQQNSESRQAFYHVFTHFISDFLHYDSSFWRTVKDLFLSPGRLSLEYMNGKRKSYVNPFTLYLFISFIAFCIPPMLPDTSNKDNKDVLQGIHDGIIGDSSDIKITKLDTNKKEFIEVRESIDSIKHEVTNKADTSETGDSKRYNSAKKIAKSIFENMKDKEKGEKAFEFFTHNLPKALFAYMPLFAFSLWLFHNKKKKYYFDSAIFTLHFFSSVLLIITITSIISCIFDWLNFGSAPYSFLYFFSTIYVTFYFFKGCRIFFEEGRIASYLKSFLLIGINNFFIFITFIVYLVIVIYIFYA